MNHPPQGSLHLLVSQAVDDGVKHCGQNSVEDSEPCLLLEIEGILGVDMCKQRAYSRKSPQ